MVGLKDRLVTSSETLRSGFDFARQDYRAFQTETDFREAVRAQADATVILDADCLTKIDADGHLVDFGEEWRLTQDAFGQLCHLAKLPVSYVTGLARRDESLALQLVEEAISGSLRNAPRQLVVNTDTQLVEGVYEEFEYDPLSNARLLDFVLSQRGDQELSRAWIEGPNARMTVVDRARVVEPKVGDVVHLGIDAQTRLGHRFPVTLDHYNERLVCSNGMITRSREFTSRIEVGEDIAYAVQRAVVRREAQVEILEGLLTAATQRQLGEDDLDKMVTRLLEPRQGGSQNLLRHVVSTADRERRLDSREEGDYVLWDFVNGVTDAAKSARTLNRQAELEGLGFNVLGTFLSAN